MAPSRGFIPLTRPRILRVLIARSLTRRYSGFVQTAADPSKKSQVYISRSLNPYLNLSIEHYLLQKSPEDSTILFLYTDRPSVIIGRNQNPWTEVNLGALRSKTPADLVRRRSGGGTVYHDEGNVNYSVICPSAVFHRDKHAEMVVRALKSLGVNTARVNSRHDIVVDKEEGSKGLKTYKVSGSAYKLTRKRSLHHGTCLLNSDNLQRISHILRAPAKPYIKARGVESVSSPITNVHIANKAFEHAVTKEFSLLYGTSGPQIVGSEEGKIPEIAKGMEELESDEWIYGQTPQFTFSTTLAPDMIIKGIQPGNLFPDGFEASFTVRHGRITEMSLEYNGEPISSQVDSEVESHLMDRHLHTITDWEAVLVTDSVVDVALSQTLRASGSGLNSLFLGKN